MDKLIIKKSPPLAGDVVISGAKNAALPLLMTSLLTSEPCRYTNVPALRDINTTVALLKELGVGVVEDEKNTVTLHAETLSSDTASYELVRTMRASILVLGPLLARLGTANVSLPGGCAIGARPVNLHLAGLEKMGANIQVDFADMSRVKRQQFVYAPLNPFIADGSMHAVSIKTFTEKDWQRERQFNLPQ